MRTLKVKWTGTQPLLMSNPQGVDVECIYAVNSRKLVSDMKDLKRKRKEDLFIENSRKQKENDFYSSAYFDEEKKMFFIPDTVILACLKQAAQTIKMGKDIDRSVWIEETQSYVEGVPPVKSLEEAFKTGEDGFVYAGPAKIPPKTGALVWKARCMMPIGWVIQFEIGFLEDQISEKSLREINELAGNVVGIGSWRPRYGRFEVEFLG